MQTRVGISGSWSSSTVTKNYDGAPLSHLQRHGDKTLHPLQHFLVPVSIFNLFFVTTDSLRRLLSFAESTASITSTVALHFLFCPSVAHFPLSVIGRNGRLQRNIHTNVSSRMLRYDISFIFSDLCLVNAPRNSSVSRDRLAW